ncbi:MAG: hypothetical protein A2Z11_03635 [Candidatus Woykebacteria bacterium RBG_16_43_9]|uniref:PIN domain-containing protein n=1 Tax=Candidatus Woykebacteria bacterium RBG_16_43_9 TaxID=1802596 RepID=A0A1G1WCR6_9BACT|nr:MAG: hypothetical protein A2Z11_03635 [Candidatus Woykebacteria bacterium RBG_16_43_9]
MAISTERKRVLVDTDAFVALRDNKDYNHNTASVIAAHLKENQATLFTSSFSFGEAITVISQKLGRTDVLAFIDKFPETDVIRIDIGNVLIEKGIDIFKSQTSKNVSFTDCVNMAVMKEEDIKEIFSFDKIYKKNGFIRLGLDKSLEGEVVDEDKS